MQKRIFLSGIFHETNTFVEPLAKTSPVRIARDGEILKCLGDDSTVDGFLQTARDYGWEVIPGVVYRAAPCGHLADEIFETFWKEFLCRLQHAFSERLDAIFLVLHGAMATAKLPDVEGELLRRIRETPEAASLPIFVVLDLHANVSEEMARHATALIPYQENPHTDARATAVRAARHLRNMWAKSLKLRTYYRHSRLLLAPPSTGTSEDPMLTLKRMARSLERSAGHLEVGIAPGFAHADTPDTGLTFWIVSDRPEISCTQSLEMLYREARHLVRELKSGEWDLAEAVRQIEKEKQFPALLVEPADNIGGGAPGDATFILRALLETSLEKCGVIINDSQAVAALQTVAPGQTARISVGGKGSSFDPGPVDLEVTLVRLTDGHFDLEDKQSHLVSMRGSHIEMESCAVVTHRNLTILLTSRATPPFDLGQWRSQGIDPEMLNVIGVKAAVGHRRAYDPIIRSSYTVSTPGPCSSNLFALPYRKLRRPIYPLDEA
ncbi:MAG: M81 family metallopeptidase [Terrimicrobiaceae bacterium]